MMRFSLLCLAALSLPQPPAASFAAATEPIVDVNNDIDADIILEEASPLKAAADVVAPSEPVTCSIELNSYCPPNTTCCPKYGKKNKTSVSSQQQYYAREGGGLVAGEEREIVGYSCLLSWAPSRIPQGPCCDDSDSDYNDEEDSAESFMGSGCAVGYTCAAPLSSSSFLQLETNGDEELALGPHCKRDDASHPVDKLGRPIENEYELMPRYKTCPAFALEDISEPYGLPIPSEAASYNKSTKGNLSTEEADGDGIEYMGQLAYFTNMGPLAMSDSHDDNSSVHEDVTTAVIGIHGSGRDATSYICAMISAVMANEKSGGHFSASESEIVNEEMEDKMMMEDATYHRKRSFDVPISTLRGRKLGAQDGETVDSTFKKDKVLVIAPWFLAPADGEVSPSSLASSMSFLRWDDDAPIAHTFRYGAESIAEESTATTISSYGAMDVLLETLCDRTNYPNLERIVVAGHSAGGQFVHRWGLSSDSWCFGDSNRGDGESNRDLPFVRLVAANPRSYAYLDGRRYLPPTVGMAEGAAKATTAEDDSVAITEDNDGRETNTLTPFDDLNFRTPSNSELDDCQEYNQYCWGLEDNPDLPAPYITNHVDKLMTSIEEEGNDEHDYTELFCRYASRDIVYLSGQRDTKHLGNQICDEDGYQGPSRRERSERFYESLQVRGMEVAASGGCDSDSSGVDSEENDQVHDRILVKHVGHDHALIFQSEEGLEGMFS